MEPRRRNKAWMHGRSAHRQRSHDAMHAGAASQALPPVLVHGLVPAGEPSLITRQSDLDSHLQALRAAGTFAYDTEFIGEHSYHPNLCVVQTATPSQLAIIDPLADGMNLRGLWELILDPAVKKIVHAGEQDLEPVCRHTQMAAANVHDTQVLAAFAGCGYPVSMSRLVREQLGADPGHGLTFSQWDRRPLSPVQVQYAANDVRYLCLLCDHLEAKAAALDNLAWAREECGNVCAIERFTFNPATQRLRLRGADSLTPRELVILGELLAWREVAAEQENIPPRALLRDSVLMDLTRNPVQSTSDLPRVFGLPRPVENRWGNEIVRRTVDALQRPAPEKNGQPRVDRWTHRKNVDRIWARVQERCAARSIDAAIVASKREISSFARDIAAGADAETAAGRLLEGWRRELLHDVLCKPCTEHA